MSKSHVKKGQSLCLSLGSPAPLLAWEGLSPRSLQSGCSPVPAGALGPQGATACPLVKGKQFLGGSRAHRCCSPCRRHSRPQLAAWVQLTGCRTSAAAGSWGTGAGVSDGDSEQWPGPAPGTHTDPSLEFSREAVLGSSPFSCKALSSPSPPCASGGRESACAWFPRAHVVQPERRAKDSGGVSSWEWG